MIRYDFGMHRAGVFLLLFMLLLPAAPESRGDRGRCS